MAVRVPDWTEAVRCLRILYTEMSEEKWSMVMTHLRVWTLVTTEYQPKEDWLRRQLEGLDDGRT